MSHSPVSSPAPGAAEKAPSGSAAPAPGVESYRAGWSAVNKLLRRGHSWSGHEAHCAYVNLGNGRFADVSSVTGLDFAEDGRAAARVDWDDDGDLDLFVAARTAPRLRYLRNDLADPSEFLSLELVGTVCNRDAIGARVELWLAGEDVPRLRTVRAGEGFLAQSSHRVHFGLAGGQRVERVVVRWPGGEPETFQEPRAGRWTLRQGGGASRREREPAPALEPSVPLPPAASGRARVVLSAPMPLPALRWMGPDGSERGLFGIGPEGPRGAGRPVLVVAWASWCEPCLRELRELAGRAPELQEAGVAVLALDLDEPGARAAAARYLDRIRWPFERGVAPAATIDVLDVLHGAVLDTEERLAIPTSFLVDREGRLAVLYRGPVGVDTLLDDLDLLDADPAARRDAAVPYAGRWRSEPSAYDPRRLEHLLLKRGFGDAARELHLAGLEQVRTDRAELRWRFGRSLGEAGRWEEAVEHYRAALADDPYLVDAWRDLGVVLHRLGEFDGAVEAYGEALRLLAQDAGTIYNLGLTHLQRRDASAVLLQAVRLRELGDPRAEELEAWAHRLE